MATITKQKRKNGTSYRVQVQVKIPATGKLKTYSTTYLPPMGISRIEQEKELKAFAYEYEKQIKNLSHSPLSVNGNITLRDYSKIFLEQMEKQTSANYHASCLNHVPSIVEYLGNYKLNELRPLIIQQYIDDLKNLIYRIVKYTAKPRFYELRQKEKLSYEKLAKLANISVKTLKVIGAGDRVEFLSAKKVSDAFKYPIEELFEEHKKVSPYSSESLAKKVRILKHMLSLAQKYELVDKNYASSQYVKGIQGVPKESEIMDLDEAILTLEHLNKEQDIRAVTAILIGIYMGRRRGEVAGLQWTDIDLIEGEMQVNRSRSTVCGKGVIEKEPKTTHSAKTYSMPKSLTEQLIKYKKWWDCHVENVIGDNYKGVPYLFLQYSGEPINPTTINFWWKKIKQKYNLKDVNYHSLRKTNISVQYASNLIPSEIIAGRAGHANDKVTKEKYMKLFKSDDKRTAQIVDAIFAKKA